VENQSSHQVKGEVGEVRWDEVVDHESSHQAT